MNTEKDQYPHVEVFQARNGKGVRATSKQNAGEVVYTVSGALVSCDIDDDMTEEERANTYRFDADTYLSPKGTMGDFFNHSCVPNTKVVKDGGVLKIIAISSILPMQEITFDYSTITAPDDVWEMTCNCGENVCRGMISNVNTLPDNQFEMYVENEMIPKHILEIGE